MAPDMDNQAPFLSSYWDTQRPRVSGASRHSVHSERDKRHARLSSWSLRDIHPEVLDTRLFLMCAGLFQSENKS